MIKRYVKWLFAVMLCFVAFSVSASAEEVTLVDLDSRQNIIVTVTYDKEEPSVTIKSPSGDVYSSDGDYAAVERGENALYLYIKDAGWGEWTIDVDKKSNTTVEAMVFPWEEALEIDSLTVESYEDNKLTVSAEVSSEKSRYFDYYLYAVVLDGDGNAVSSQLIADGTAHTGNSFNIKANTSKLPDGEYHLELEAVFKTDSGVEMPSFFMTDSTFKVKGNISQGDKEMLVSELDLTNDILVLDWSTVEEKVTSWELVVDTETSDTSSIDPHYYSAEFTSDFSYDEILLNRDLGDISVKLTGTLRDGGYITFEKTIAWDNGITVTFDTPEITNSYSALISYDTGGETLRAVITLNGSAEDLMLSGNSSISLTLNDMEINNISLRYSLEEGSYYLMSQKVSVDSVPPSIDLYGISDYIYSSSDKITISGKTEADAVLTINGEQHELEDSGSFTATISLRNGRNNIVIEAQDVAGNMISRSFTVDRTTATGTASEDNKNSGFKFPWIIAAALAGTLFSFLMICIFSKTCNSRIEKYNVIKYKNTQKTLAVVKGILTGLSATSAGIAVFFIIRYNEMKASISGSNLLDALQNNSTEKMAELISITDDYKKFFIILIIAAAVFLAMFIGLTVFENQFKTMCPTCGAKIDKSKKFCSKCGTELNFGNTEPNDKKGKDSPSNG